MLAPSKLASGSGRDTERTEKSHRAASRAIEDQECGFFFSYCQPEILNFSASWATEVVSAPVKPSQNGSAVKAFSHRNVPALSQGSPL